MLIINLGTRGNEKKVKPKSVEEISELKVEEMKTLMKTEEKIDTLSTQHSEK